MAYKWKPSASQRRAFAEKMQDPAEKAAYEARKSAKASKRRAGSKFDYHTAGGSYKPTQQQADDAMRFCFRNDLTPEQINACNMIVSAYSCNESVHHDYIHIVNELRRAEYAI